MCLGTVKGKLWVASLLTVQKNRELTKEGFGKHGIITLKQLGLAEEDQVGLVLFTEVFKMEVVPLKTFDIPREAL